MTLVIAAQSAQTLWKVPAAITLAQWVLESDRGRAMPPQSNNPFGIKAVRGQAFVSCETKEYIGGKSVTVVARFRKFASIGEAFREHARLLATNFAYHQAMTKVGKPDAFARALTGIYATDPRYGEKLISIMTSYDLYRYDKFP